MQKDLLLDSILRQLRINAVKKHITPNSVVCDIGCGAKGSFLKAISGNIAQGIGIDKRVDNYNNSKLRFINNDLGTSLPLESSTIDYATIIAVIEHVDHPQEILKEIYRILKPGGKIILTTPSPSSKAVLEILAFKLHLISKELIEEHKYYFNKAELQKSLDDIGFKSINIKNFEFNYNILAIAEK